MPSLASMRSLDPAGDSFQPLGPPIRQAETPAKSLPKPTQTPGVVQMPDGKLQTNLPLPEAPAKLSRPISQLEAYETVARRYEAYMRKSMELMSKCVLEANVQLVSAPRDHGKRPDFIVMDDLKMRDNFDIQGCNTGRFKSSAVEAVRSAAEVALNAALCIAIKDPNYPTDGTVWTPHIPGSIPPNDARWVVLRNGQVRYASSVRSWAAGSDTEGGTHSPVYEVVGWK